MRLIDQVKQLMSYTVLSAETGVSRYQLRRVMTGEAKPERRIEVNKALRGVQSGGIYQTSKATGIKATARTVEIEKPAIRKLSTPKAIEFENQVKAIKKDHPRYTKGEIQGLLERDQDTRQRLAKALNAYQQAKSQAIKDYKRYHVKSMTRQEYIQSKTGKEYKALSKAIDQRRKTEAIAHFKKLVTEQYIDLSIENYGRGKGQWYRVK